MRQTDIRSQAIPLGTALAVGAAGLGGWLAVRALREARALNLKGRMVLITGGSRGLGLVLARELAARGARLAICGRDEDALWRACEDLAERGANVLGLVCDVKDPHQVRQCVAEVERRRGSIDVLINNASIISVGPMDTMTEDDYRESLAINFWAPYHMIHSVLPGMRRRGEGYIVNISSIGGKVSVPHLLPYSAGKFALTGFSEGLRAELAGTGVVVTTVCPGLMRTGSPRNANFKGQHREEYAWFSISDALPGLSIGAERAARQIIDAFRHGDAEVILTPAARAATWFHGLFPGLTADVLGVANRFLPGPGDRGTAATPGKDSTSSVSPSLLTTLGDRAARRNNEIPPGERAEDRLAGV